MSKLAIYLFGLFVLGASFGNAQENLIYNPSFEGMHRCCMTPDGWYDCGSPEETAPDIQPGQFGVTLAPQDGESYLGMVVRDSRSCESVSQWLNKPLRQDSTYILSLFLARSEKYLSMSRITRQGANYSTPVQLLIYGGSYECDKDELLAESEAIENTTWQKYEFVLKPKQTFDYIVLAVNHSETYYYQENGYYNGNLLLDLATLQQL